MRDFCKTQFYRKGEGFRGAVQDENSIFCQVQLYNNSEAFRSGRCCKMGRLLALFEADGNLDPSTRPHPVSFSGDDIDHEPTRLVLSSTYYNVNFRRGVLAMALLLSR